MPGSASLITYALVLVLLIAVIVVTTLVLRRQRYSAWRQFARDHNLQFRRRPRLRVAGRVRDRNFELGVSDSSSDTGVLGVEEVAMGVQLHGHVPKGLELVQVAPALAEIGAALRDDTVTTGDEEFDHTYVVRAEDGNAAIEYFDDQRRAALVQLARDADFLVAIRQGYLLAESREMVTVRERLDAWFERLLEAAPKLDAAPR
ncbi:MAG: hypothetical protein WDZ59_08335 [Pirellulales bacterium]